MAQERPQKYLMIRVTLLQPSEANGAEAGDTAALVALASVDATNLHGAEELSAIAAIRIKASLTMLLEQYGQQVAEYNAANPLPEPEAAEGEEDDPATEFQA